MPSTSPTTSPPPPYTARNIAISPPPPYNPQQPVPTSTLYKYARCSSHAIGKFLRFLLSKSAPSGWTRCHTTLEGECRWSRLTSSGLAIPIHSSQPVVFYPMALASFFLPSPITTHQAPTHHLLLPPRAGPSTVNHLSSSPPVGPILPVQAAPMVPGVFHQNTPFQASFMYPQGPSCVHAQTQAQAPFEAHNTLLSQQLPDNNQSYGLHTQNLKVSAGGYHPH